MFEIDNEKKAIIEQVIFLANDCNKYNPGTIDTSLNMFLERNSLKNMKYFEKSCTLTKYLNSKDEDTVNFIRYAMYIGRDIKPEEETKEKIDFFIQRLKTSDSKEIMVSTIESKSLRLGKYLRNGIRILGKF